MKEIAFLRFCGVIALLLSNFAFQLQVPINLPRKNHFSQVLTKTEVFSRKNAICSVCESAKLANFRFFPKLVPFSFLIYLTNLRPLQFDANRYFGRFCEISES